MKFTTLYAEEAEQGSGGGGGSLMGASPAPVDLSAPSGNESLSESQQQGQLTPILTEDGNFSAQWYQGNEELAPFAGQLDKFKTPAALAKSYATLERNRTVPADGAEESAIEAFREVNGIPKTYEEYEIKMPEEMPEGVVMSEEALGQYKETFHGLNLTPHQAQKLTEQHLEITSKMAADMQGQFYQAQQEAADGLQKEWGNAYSANLESAQGVFDSLCAKAGVNPEVVSFTGDPVFSKIMAAAASLASESGAIGLGGPGQGIQGGKKEAHNIMTNSNHPDHKAFYDPQDPRHVEVQDYVARINK